MSQRIFRQVWSSIQNLNPSDVRSMADQDISIGLHVHNESTLEEMERFFCPPELSRERRLEIFRNLYVAGEPNAPNSFDIEIYEEGMARPRGTFAFRTNDPQQTVADILAARDSIAVPLARLFPPFRESVVDKLIHTVSRENALFSLATALPDIIPSVIQLPWAVGEFASDTAFLTVNQVRLAFLLAAASDRPVGYKEQGAEVGSIIAGAFGWRAIARELVGKIPFGGGLIPKAAIAYAGTYVAGRAMERLYREGYTMTRQERTSAYEGAFEKGKRVAKELLDNLAPKRATT